MQPNSEAQAKVSLSAKVIRVNWENKPSFVSRDIWILMKKFRVPFTYRVENLGVISDSDSGTASVKSA